MNSVVSAAIIEGNLIIGLSDGSIINCGYVQGPQGLSGPEGPMGSTGDRGTDGNTIITVGGTPGNDIGRDGDYAIDNINWRIYGPKAGGVWGKANEMLPGPENILENGRNAGMTGGGGGGSGGGPGPTIIYTNAVHLTSPITATLSAPTYEIIPHPPTGTTTQQDANQWTYGPVFDTIDAAIPVATGATAPTPLPNNTDNYTGRLWFNTDDLTLYIYDEPSDTWSPTGSSASLQTVQLQSTPPPLPQNGDLWFDTSPDELTLYVYSEDSTAWIPAAPPTSLESRVAAGEVLQQEIHARLQTNELLTGAHTNQIDELAIKVEALEGHTLSGQWALALSGSPRPGKVLLYKEGFAPGVVSWSDVKFLGFYPEDIGGVTHDFSDIIVDEYIRFTTSVGEANGVTFKVTDNSAGASGVFGVVVNVEKGVPVNEEIYGVEFLPPFDPSQYATKEYVDSTSGGLPIGTVVMWFGASAPANWLKCDGSSFNTTTYAALHVHLQTVPNYVSGKTPNFQGLYPGGAGSSHNNNLTVGGQGITNAYHSQRTAQPNGGPPRTANKIPDGNTRSFNGSGGTNAYSDGAIQPLISEGWDAVTRPPTLSIHFIIKAL